MRNKDMKYIRDYNNNYKNKKENRSKSILSFLLVPVVGFGDRKLTLKNKVYKLENAIH